MQCSVKPLVQLTIIGALRAPGLGVLDPIRVLFDDLDHGRGHITIVCCGRAWTSYWGAMGTGLADFVIYADAGYLHDNLVRSLPMLPKRDRASEKAYLLDIIRAVQEALRQQVVAPCTQT